MLPQVVNDRFDALLQLAQDASLLELLASARLGVNATQTLLRALLAAEAQEAKDPTQKSGKDGTRSETNALSPEPLAKPLRALLRSHILGVGGSSNFQVTACKLVGLVVGSLTTGENSQLLRALGISEVHTQGLAAALFARMLDGQHDTPHGTLLLLSRCAEHSPSAVARVVPLQWLQNEIDKTDCVAVGGQEGSLPCLLMQIMASTLKHGSTCQSNLVWLHGQGTSMLRLGVVGPTIDAICAYPPELAQALLWPILQELHELGAGDVDSAALQMAVLGHAARVTAESTWAHMRIQQESFQPSNRLVGNGCSECSVFATLHVSLHDIALLTHSLFICLTDGLLNVNVPYLYA